MMFAQSAGEGVFLRKLETRDAEPLFEAFSPHQHALSIWNSGFESMVSADSFRDYIAAFRDLDARDTGLACGIWVGHEVVGIISLEDIDGINLSAMLGIWLIPPAQGRGVADSVVRTLLTYAYSELSLERVTAFVAVDNRNSQRLFERIGFRYEGVLRAFRLLQDERFVDHVAYSLLRTEYEEVLSRSLRIRVRAIDDHDREWISDRFGPSLPEPTSTDLGLVAKGQGYLLIIVNENQAEIHSLDVVPEMGGHGVRRRLLEIAEGELRRRGVRLLVARSNPSLLESFQHFGMNAVNDQVWVKTIA